MNVTCHPSGWVSPVHQRGGPESRMASGAGPDPDGDKRDDELGCELVGDQGRGAGRRSQLCARRWRRGSGRRMLEGWR